MSQATSDDQTGAWQVQTLVYSGESAGSSTSRLVEIVATHDMRADWQAKFWSLFPRATDAFEQLVRGSHGIHITVELAGPVPTRVQSQYGAYSASKLNRLMQSVAEQHAARPAPLEAALAAYMRDYGLDEAARKQVLLATLDRLPLPPAGYHWVPDYGGIVLPRVATFRLWSHALGYMPRSE